MNKFIIITEKYGALGNRLFRFARFFSFTQKERYYLIDLTFFQYSYLYTPKNFLIRFFFIGLQFLNNERLKKIEHFLSLESKITSWQLLSDQEKGEAVPISILAQFMKAMKSRGLLLTYGSFFFRSNGLEESSKKKLRTIFQLKPRYRNKAKQLLGSNKLFSQKNKIVAVHIRQGDYKLFDGGKHYFEEKVYASCMRHLLATSQEHTLAFILITKEAIDLQAFEGLPVCFFGEQSIGVDQALLQFADYILSPERKFLMSKWLRFFVY